MIIIHINYPQTPLHLAVITRQPHMVQLLVEAGASVNFPDRKGNTALHLASARRDTRILQILSRATSPLPDFNCKNFAGISEFILVHVFIHFCSELACKNFVRTHMYMLYIPYFFQKFGMKIIILLELRRIFRG